MSSQGDAGLKQVLPWQTAMPLVRQLVSADLPGYGYGQSPCRVERADWCDQVFSGGNLTAEETDSSEHADLALFPCHRQQTEGFLKDD